MGKSAEIGSLLMLVSTGLFSTVNKQVLRIYVIVTQTDSAHLKMIQDDNWSKITSRTVVQTCFAFSDIQGLVS